MNTLCKKAAPEAVFLPCYRRRWKASTAITDIDRMRRHLKPALADRALRGFTRDQLQTFWDEKCAEGLSFSMVAHLRWDLHQLFEPAQAEGYIDPDRRGGGASQAVLTLPSP